MIDPVELLFNERGHVVTATHLGGGEIQRSHLGADIYSSADESNGPASA
ncbi:hypothetical protein QTL95_15855 [Rhizobium sp. S152]|nr:hypothetical protein [Rhizobium sp. S152]MDM9627383.1 hypothetical protein [Rhizobium sp. S152]